MIAAVGSAVRAEGADAPFLDPGGFSGGAEAEIVSAGGRLRSM